MLSLMWEGRKKSYQSRKGKDAKWKPWDMTAEGTIGKKEVDSRGTWQGDEGRRHLV